MMKQLTFLFFAVVLLGCSSGDKKAATSDPTTPETSTEKTTEESEKSPGNEDKEVSCWKGTLDGKTNIYVSVQSIGNTLVGEITYLDTKSKKPIALIGEVMEDNYFRLLEFDNKGYISGIVTGEFDGEEIKGGEWFSPKSRKHLTMKLTPDNKTVAAKKLEVDRNSIFGEYYYQYGPEGATGMLRIKSLGGNRATFELNAVTGAPAYNIADIQKDTVTLDENSFVYPLTYTDGCEIEVKFFRTFAQVLFPNGYCDGGFGHNATPEGFFYKVK